VLVRANAKTTAQTIEELQARRKAVAINVSDALNTMLCHRLDDEAQRPPQQAARGCNIVSSRRPSLPSACGMRSSASLMASPRCPLPADSSLARWIFSALSALVDARKVSAAPDPDTAHCRRRLRHSRRLIGSGWAPRRVV